MTKNTLVNAKHPLYMPKCHFVLFAGHSSKSGVLGNGHNNRCIITFPYYRSTFKKHALLWQNCWSSGN